MSGCGFCTLVGFDAITNDDNFSNLTNKQSNKRKAKNNDAAEKRYNRKPEPMDTTGDEEIVEGLKRLKIVSLNDDFRQKISHGLLIKSSQHWDNLILVRSICYGFENILKTNLFSSFKACF
jgi:hypothetical protein